MIIRPAHQADWQTFTALARAEQWRVPRFERELFAGPWAQSAHVLDDGGFCALITAVAYEKSAWIGNLIVPGPRRGKGYGSRLFRAVLEDLAGRGVASVWLTASEQGRDIYAREGFVAVDFIERWVMAAPGGSSGSCGGAATSCAALLHGDRLAWGEYRRPLLSVLHAGGKTFTAGPAVALLQSWPDLQILGPWYAAGASPDAHRQLLATMLAALDPHVEVVADLLASSPGPALCELAGFRLAGRTTLMAYGDIGAVDLRRMVSLASLGSVG